MTDPTTHSGGKMMTRVVLYGFVGILLFVLLRMWFPEKDKITRRYDHQFKWVLFLVLPLAISVFYLSQDWSRLPKILDFCTRGPYMTASALISSLWTVCLLKKYAWSKKGTDA